MNSKSNTKIIEDTICDLEERGQFDLEKTFLQHRMITVFDHSVHVATVSLKLADLFHLKIDKEVLTKGALLHDYFLYDWHKTENRPKWHGFTHPGTALKNAQRDFDLSEKEKDIILKHMFPLTLRAPKYKESWIVCLADKGCTIFEILFPFFMKDKGKTGTGHD